MKNFNHGKWFLEFMSDDGGRIGALAYEGIDILRRKPVSFSPPEKDYGLYETRPVYGYDDCFPSVDACKFPSGLDWNVPDHGELCWLKWDSNELENGLEFKVASRVLPLVFTRRIIFSENVLTWDFEVQNNGMASIPFLHVMHPLMPLGAVTGLELPAFLSVFDEKNKKETSFSDASVFSEDLLRLPKGTFNMFVLRNICSGMMSISFKGEFKMAIEFPESIFPCLGIWWNNSGYPDEDGCRRCECAFEPLPGYCSSIEKCVREGAFMTVLPEASSRWKIKWTVSRI